jgi:hypothetical protein
MARGRMISGSIATSESFHAMSEYARLTWCMILPHLDDYGTIEGSAAKLKGLTQPLSARSVAEVAAAVREIVDVEILTAYAVDGRVYLRAPSFDRHQVNLHKRTAPKFPDPEGAEKLTGERYLEMALSRKFPEPPGKSVPREVNEVNEVNEVKRKNSNGEIADAVKSGRSKVKGRTFADDSREMQFSRHLFERICRHTPDATQPNWEGWARDFDRIFRVDSRDPNQVLAVIDWATADTAFWQRQILSPGALRGKTRKGVITFDLLLGKMRETSPFLRRRPEGLEGLAV